MRQSPALRTLASTALALLLSVSHGQFASASSAPDQAGSESFDIQGVDSYAGAFLAARTAETDRDYPNAVKFYKKALEFTPNELELQQRLMIALFMNGEFDEGADLARTLESDPAVERVTSVALGFRAIRDGDYSDALKHFKYEGPNDLDRLMNQLLIAWAMVGDGKGKEALKLVQELEGPSWYGIFRNYNAGVIAAQTGDIDAARKALTDTVTDRNGGATAPDTFARAVMALSTLEAGAGNKQKALDALAAGDELITNFAPFKALRDEIEAGRQPDPIVANAVQGAAGVLFSIGGALNREGAEDTVMLYLQLSHALDKDAADTLVLLGGIAENAKQPEKAIAFYRQVPETSPMRRISELQLGLTLAETGKVKEAREHLQGLIASDPNDVRSYLAYGSVLSDSKDYGAMADNYDKAIEIIGQTPARNHWSVYFQRGIAYERLKKWDKAEPNFSKALELNPDQPQVLNYLGYSWVDMNRNLQEGLEMIKKAVELRPDDGYIVDSLGWAYYRLGRFDEAVVELERAIELRAGDATINDHLGDAYWRVGRKLEATYQWKRALASEPEEAEVPKIQAKINKGLPPIESDAAKVEANPAEEPKKDDKKT
ncbi:tetratricopeptide repeat protein [Rhizobium sp. 'Codium 1']|uniref:tetratricopeptide repeat protein n=1 Tax=Rhizobium sp. 'Codium 1' TaxID=2940484 RepID=UPI001E4D291D|nr:tetratricopeptide repeat protein [Rhizobium sp. 'Codium 1']MCC8931163.1 tetratricopeptide repeat protein [Rhizobium sp. 'Codium 1']